MRHLLILFLLPALLLSACGSLQPEEPAAVSPKFPAQSLLDSGDEVFSTPRLHPYHARSIYLAAAEAAKQENNSSVLVEAYVQIAHCHRSIGEHEEAKRWFACATALAREDEPNGWSRYLAGRPYFEGALYFDGREKPEVRHIREVLYAYCMKHHLYGRALDAACTILANVDASEKLGWLEKARTAAELEDNRYKFNWFWSMAAGVYEKVKDYPKMLDALLKARTFPRRFESDCGFIEEYTDLARAYRLNNRLEEARTWGENAVQWARIRFDSQHVGPRHDIQGFGYDTDNELPFCMSELAEIVFAQGDKARALAIYREAREIYSQTGGLHGPIGIEAYDSRIAELEK